jgi:hypothetical protein
MMIPFHSDDLALYVVSPAIHMQASEHLWHTRVLVQGPARSDGSRDEGTFVFTLSQRVGGIYDGYWFCDSLVADGNDWDWMRGTAPPGRLI